MELVVGNNCRLHCGCSDSSLICAFEESFNIGYTFKGKPVEESGRMCAGYNISADAGAPADFLTVKLADPVRNFQLPAVILCLNCIAFGLNSISSIHNENDMKI